MTTLDENMLIAYVDGELDSETAREVEAMLGDNADAKQFVERQRAIVALARIAFNDTLHEEVPEHLIQAATASPRDSVSGGNVVAMPARPANDWRRALPMAAAIAGLLIGGGSGFGISQQRTQGKIELAAYTIEQDRRGMDDALNQALEVNLSGTPLEWDSPSSANTVQFTPVRTYQDKTGRYCREYRQEVVQDGENVATFGLACRNEEGRWKTRYLIFDNETQAL
ncbi:MAG: hypothetical protein KAI73_04175 [Rhodospirillaceae bacterium]|nr:hypothetical protein [Rhodospirillaceae bacterium]